MEIIGKSAVNLDQCLNSSEQGIFPKLDWITIVFNNVSINFVLSFIHCSFMQEDLVQAEYDRNYGVSAWVSYRVGNSGIKVEAKRDQIDSFNGLCVLDRECKQLRLDISATGLDYLRSEKDIDVESFFRQSIPVSSDGSPLYHFTRADLAFDLVNYCPEFMNAFSQHVHGLEYGSLRVRGSKGPIKTSERYGTKEHTFYVGSSTSDRMLRIYDKLLEFSSSRKKKPLLETLFPVSSVDSWIRFELQCRNDVAQHFLLNYPDYLSVYMWVFDYYAPVKCDQFVSDFWYDIWKPDYVPYVIQNLQFIHSVPTKEDVICKVGNSVDVHTLYWTNRPLFHKLMEESLIAHMKDTSRYGSNWRLRFFNCLSLVTDGEDGNINWDSVHHLKKVFSDTGSTLIPVD